MIENHSSGDYSEFNPWPFLNRIGGVMLVILGYYWLTPYYSSSLQISKAVMAASGILLGFALRPVPTGYMNMPDKSRLKRKKWFYAATILTILAGLSLGIGNLDPFSPGLALHFFSGGAAICFGARLLISKQQRQIYHQQVEQSAIKANNDI